MANSSPSYARIPSAADSAFTLAPKAWPRRHRRGRARPASGRRRNRAHRRCRIYVHRPARRDVHRSRAPRILRLAAARRLGALAVLAASGKVRRPAIIGTEPIPVILHIKYQYGLR